MRYLAECSIDDAIKYNGNLFVVEEVKSSQEGKESKEKKHRVYLNIVTDRLSNIPFDELGPAVACITLTSDGIKDIEVPARYKNKIFKIVDRGDFCREALDEDLIVIVKYEDDFHDMLDAFKLCNEYKNLRVIGGNLLQLKGVRIGRVDELSDLGIIGKEKSPLICDGKYDAFEEVSITELNDIKETFKKEIDCTQKAKKVSKRKVNFSSVFGEETVDF